jgi:hypothetical protein
MPARLTRTLPERDLIRCYARVAPVLVPHLAGRPTAPRGVSAPLRWSEAETSHADGDARDLYPSPAGAGPDQRDGDLLTHAGQVLSELAIGPARTGPTGG